MWIDGGSRRSSRNSSWDYDGYCFDFCDKPIAKKAADLSSTILYQLNFLFDAKPIAKGTFLDPGDITTSKKSNLRHDKINV